jgi:hypothetical protein
MARILFLAPVLVFSGMAFAQMDGSNLPACKGVTDVCMAANVSGTDSKNGKAMHGYQPGEHKRDGEGLWADCVAKLAHGKEVPGVTGVTQQQARACLDASKAARHTHKK